MNASAGKRGEWLKKQGHRTRRHELPFRRFCSVRGDVLLTKWQNRLFLFDMRHKGIEKSGIISNEVDTWKL